MNQKQVPAASPGMKIGDIYYVLFRHKWKILLISALGIAASAWFYMASPWTDQYVSKAMLLVKYVADKRVPAPEDPTEGLSKPLSNPIDTERAILSSADVANAAAERMPVELLPVLQRAGIGTNTGEIAGAIGRGLTVEIGKNSSVMLVQFTHTDRDIPKAIMTNVIAAYLDKHVSVHREVGVYDNFIKEQIREYQRNLNNLEEDLRIARAKVNTVSVEDSKKLYSEQIARLKEELFNAETDLAIISNSIVAMPRTPSSTNEQPVATALTPLPKEQVAEYGRLLGTIKSLYERESGLLVVYSPESILVKSVREQIAAAETRKQKLEEEYPTLLATTTNEGGPAVQPVDPRVTANNLITRINRLHQRLAGFQAEMAALIEAESEINEKQRQKEIAEANYRYFLANQERSKIDRQLTDLRANISEIERPTAASLAPSKKVKVALMILLGSIFGSIGLAFASEMFLDRSVRRPADLRGNQSATLFLSVPRLQVNNYAKALLSAGSRKQIGNGADPSAAGQKSRKAAPIPSQPAVLQPFSETLRDRLITFFEINNMTHKPKLVAVTSCAEGSGVSTISAGLAASLSETGEGNVLLVDMNARNGAAHQFHKGQLAMGIDEALGETRQDALVQDNLYVVRESKGGSAATSVMPKRFRDLVPRLKASDYDYIIFDMPPVSQISMTPRLAKFMDITLMVVESEKTDRDLVRRASELLSESKTHVGLVLNKARNYVPKALGQELV